VEGLCVGTWCKAGLHVCRMRRTHEFPALATVVESGLQGRCANETPPDLSEGAPPTFIWKE
jgi:hypothetical protein